MRHKGFIIFIFLIILVVALFGLNPSLRGAVLGISDYVKLWIIEKKDNISLSFDMHFSQAQKIEELSKKLADYDKIVLERNALDIELNRLLGLFSSDMEHVAPKIYLARILSFVGFGDLKRMWLHANIKNQNDEHLYGLVKDNVVLGVASTLDGRLIAYLNGDPKCNYSVYIGEQRSIGMLTSDETGRVMVSFIPTWLKVNIGDKVVTSGLDGIFTENIDVGVVEQINEDYGYLNAIIQPYSSQKSLDYMWLVDRGIVDSNITKIENFGATSTNIKNQDITFGGAFSVEKGSLKESKALSIKPSSIREE